MSNKDEEKLKSSSSLGEKFEMLYRNLIDDDKSLYSEKDSVVEGRRGSITIEQNSLNFSLLNNNNATVNKNNQNNMYCMKTQLGIQNNLNEAYSFVNNNSNNESHVELSKNLIPNNNFNYNNFIIEKNANNFQQQQYNDSRIFNQGYINQSKRSVSHNNLNYNPELFEQNRIPAMVGQSNGYYFDPHSQVQRNFMGQVNINNVGQNFNYPQKTLKERTERNKFNTSRINNNMKFVANLNTMGAYPNGNPNLYNPMQMGNFPKNMYDSRLQFYPSDQNLSLIPTDHESEGYLNSGSINLDNNYMRVIEESHPYFNKNQYISSYTSQPNSRLASTSNRKYLFYI